MDGSDISCHGELWKRPDSVKCWGVTKPKTLPRPSRGGKQTYNDDDDDSDHNGQLSAGFGPSGPTPEPLL